VDILLAYAGIGFLFAVAFVVFGVTRVDPAAKGSGVGFRLLLIPGVAAFWPWLLYQWMRSTKGHPS
jgi:hypothetical protein